MRKSLPLLALLAFVCRPAFADERAFQIPGKDAPVAEAVQGVAGGQPIGVYFALTNTKTPTITKTPTPTNTGTVSLTLTFTQTFTPFSHTATPTPTWGKVLAQCSNLAGQTCTPPATPTPTATLPPIQHKMMLIRHDGDSRIPTNNQPITFTAGKIAHITGVQIGVNGAVTGGEASIFWTNGGAVTTCVSAANDCFVSAVASTADSNISRTWDRWSGPQSDKDFLYVDTVTDYTTTDGGNVMITYWEEP